MHFRCYKEFEYFLSVAAAHKYIVPCFFFYNYLKIVCAIMIRRLLPFVLMIVSSSCWSILIFVFGGVSPLLVYPVPFIIDITCAFVFPRFEEILCYWLLLCLVFVHDNILLPVSYPGTRHFRKHTNVMCSCSKVTVL